MISNQDLIENIEPENGNVIIANHDRIPVKELGNLKLFDKNSEAFFMHLLKTFFGEKATCD